MYKRRWGWVKHFDFFFLDLICISIGYFLAWSHRFDGADTNFDWYVGYAAIVLLIYYAEVPFLKPYKNILRRGIFAELRMVSLQFLVTYITFSAFLYLTKAAENYSRLMYIIAGVLGFILVCIERFIWKQIVRKHLMGENKRAKLILVGTRERCLEYLTAVKKQSSYSHEIMGMFFLDDSGKDIKSDDHSPTLPQSHQEQNVGSDLKIEKLTVIEGVPLLGGKDDYMDYALNNVVDEVYIAGGSIDEDIELANSFLEMGVTAHIGLPVRVYLGELPNAVAENMHGFTVITASNAIASEIQLTIKRIMDIIGGLAGVIICAIIYLFVAPQIKKADPGPVFFSQERVGKNGRIFKMYKFRSMYLDAEARKAELMSQNNVSSDFMFKMKDDPRILPGIGNFIRNTSLDEFPQFMNILKGDMSLVGTRPPTVSEFEKYSPHHKIRLSFKPGLTGMWQTSGRSDITDFEEVVKLDNEYIRNWNLGLDFKLLFKTFWVVIRGEGSM